VISTENCKRDGYRLGASVAQEKKDESFRVVDRRLFTPEGDLRQEVAEEQRREQQRAEKPATPARGSKPGGATTAVESKPTTKEEAQPISPEPGDEGAAQTPSRGFEMLVNMLAQNAAALLGAIADPRTGQGYVDLEGAREMIEMLDVLREKTRGNLANEDEQLLLEVIGSLKLSYMEVSKAAAEAMRTKAKGKT
jgi:hypothetical protein